jgi:hypothetical protein
LVGDQVTVKVISSEDGDVASDFSIETNGVRRGEVISEGDGSRQVSAEDSEGTWFRVIRSVELDAITADLESMRITVRRKHEDEAAVSQTYELVIRARTFYIDWGVAATFVIEGKRKVVGEASIQTDMRPSAAFALTWYPAGRMEGRVSYWEKKAVKRWFGVTIGTDFDFTKQLDNKDYYFGLTIAPIAGLGLVVGGAAILGEYLPQSTITDDEATGMMAVDHKYMARFFVGAFVTIDIIKTAIDKAGDARNLFRADR